MTTDTLTRIKAARAALVLDQPFFGVLALNLRIELDTTCQTAWTDGRSLGFNPGFVAGLDAEALKGLIAHEVMHCACGHPWRRGGRDHKRFNVACDYAINAVIRDAGFTLPEGALLSPDYSGKHAEWIYDRLPADDQQSGQSGQQSGQQPGQQPNGQQSGQSGQQPGQQPADEPGEVRDAPADTDADAGDLTESEWQEIATQAQAQARGTLPAGAARGIAELRRPRVDWRSAMRRFFQETIAADYTWSRPASRYLASGLFLPSLRSEACGPIVVAIDTSGSIDRVLLSQFESELRSIVAEIKPRAVHVIYCDAEVNATAEFGPDDPIDLVPHGGGGTAFTPVFDHVEREGIDPVALVYLTDLAGDQPTEPGYPVLWGSTDPYRAAPFGEVVPLN